MYMSKNIRFSVKKIVKNLLGVPGKVSLLLV